MRIAHLSDLHICKEHRIQNIRKVELLLARALESGADHLVITGDISHLGREQDFAVLRNLLRNYNLLDPLKTSLTIGNHDIFGGVHLAEEILTFPANCRQVDYRDRVHAFIAGFPELFEQTVSINPAEFFPYVKYIGQYALIGLNSIAGYSWHRNPMASNGEISNSQIHNLQVLLNDRRMDGKIKIVLVHHHFGINGSEPRNFLERIEHHTMKLHNRNRILKLLVNFDVELVLHGHLHINNHYTIRGCRFVNGGASVEGMLNLNIVDIAQDQINILTQQLACPDKNTEEIYNAGHYVPSFAG